MKKRNRVIDVRFVLIVIILSALPQCWSALSNKRLCFDPDCSEPISHAKTLLNYNANEEGLLSFEINVNVIVYSKGAGNRSDLWGVEINGKRGYVPKALLKEVKVLKSELLHEVPTKTLFNNNNESKILQSKKVTDKLKSVEELPHSVTVSYEIIDGTTLYADHNESFIQPSPTTEILQTKVVSNKDDVILNLGTDSNNKENDTIFARSEESPEKDLNSKVINDDHSISQKDDNDFAESSKEILNAPQINGIKSSLDSRDNVKNDILRSVEHAEQISDKKITELQGIHSLKEQSVPERKDVQLSEEHTVTKVKDTDLSEKQSVSKENDVHSPEKKSIPKIRDVQLTEEHTVTKAKDEQLSEKQSVPKVKGVQLSEEHTVTKVKDTDLSEKQSVSKENDVHSPEKKSIPKIRDVQLTEEHSVTKAKDEQLSEKQSVPKVKGVQLSEEHTVTKVKDTDLSEKQSVSKENDVHSPEKKSIPKIRDVQLTEEHSVTKAKDEQLSEKQSVPKVKGVQLSEEHSVIEVKDEQLSEKQSVPKVKGVQLSEEHSVIEVKDEQLSQKQSVPEVKDVHSSQGHFTTKIKDVKLLEEQSVSKTKDVHLSEEHIISNEQDVQISKEHSVTKVKNVQLLKKHSVPKVEDVHALGETISEVKDIQSAEEHIIYKEQDVQLSEGNSVTIEKDVQLPVIALNDIGNINSTRTVSVDNSKVDAKTAQNVSELTNTERVHPLDSITWLETSSELKKQDKASENIDHVSPLPIQSDTTENLNQNDISVITGAGNRSKELQEISKTNKKNETHYYTDKDTDATVNEPGIVDNVVESTVNKEILSFNDNSYSTNVPYVSNELSFSEINESNLNPSELLYSNQESIIPENVASINEFRNRNLLNVDIGEQYEIENIIIDKPDKNEDLPAQKDDSGVLDKHLYENAYIAVDSMSVKEATSENNLHKDQAVSSSEVCTIDNIECSIKDNSETDFINNDEIFKNIEDEIEDINIIKNYWMTFMYLIITAVATLIFSLGYYYIENRRRDGQLIAKINSLEKDLLISTKENLMLKENLKVTKDKLTCIEDESFGSNEMVVSLKADLEASQNAKSELEDQVYMLEKELENATEAGLELERMLREVLSSDNEVNPLAQSVEDLQTRLNAQQAANESLTNALNLKTQENESLSVELASLKKKYEELEVELIRVIENLKLEVDSKNNIQRKLTDKVQKLEMQIKEISNEKVTLQKELKHKEIEMTDLREIINQLNSNLDLEKLYNVTHIKAEATTLLEERNELKIQLAEVEGAHNLLEEHMKVIKEEVFALSEQCKAAEKEKKDAETRLEVLSNFFKEKEAQRQKEEAIWLQQQGEVVSTVERIQTMQTEIQNYKQQIEMLKREILDQEREYKNQISVLETKAHEQWVIARQVERRLEESKVEAGQLRNRLTLIEKNINDIDPEAKLHRLEANGETATSPPLFIGAESSSSPIMFSGSSNVPPPPPPSYLHSLFPPYLPPPLPNVSNVPPYEISQRPPPLGGRLSSPPPMPLHPSASSRLPPPPFGNDHIHAPPPPPLGSIMPAPLGTTHSWGEEPLTPLRNSGFHLSQRERVRNHKGSLHSSGESLDNLHHSSKA